MNNMTTVSQVLNKLKSQGYTVDFNLDDSCLVCHGNSLKINPDEFVVDKHYRFEGPSDPGDEAIVYAISSEKHQIKGTLVNGYGISSDSMTHEMIKALMENPLTMANNYSNAEAEKKQGENIFISPESDGPLDTQMTEMNLLFFMEKIKQKPAWHNSEFHSIIIDKSDEMRIVLIGLHEGGELKTHAAPGTISIQVLEGKIRFNTEKKTAELEKGGMLTLKSGIPHSVVGLKESIFLLTIAVSK